MNSKRIAVTGASGFIGNHLVQELLSLGHSVLAITRGEGSLKKIDKNALVHITNYSKADLESALVGCDYLVHLAARRSTRSDDPNDIRVFIDETTKLLEPLLYAARLNCLKKVISISSIAVYSSKNETPYKESMLPEPLNSYGLAKIIQEQIINLWSSKHGIPAIHLRLSACYGIGEKISPVLMKFVSQACKKEQLKVVGDGMFQIDQIYVADAINAIINAINTEVSGAFNIGGGRSYSVCELAETVNMIYENRESVLKEAEIPFQAMSYQTRYMDINKANKELNWSPSFSLESGLQFMKNINIDRKY
jgi:UDP-glucose 4-epimerase